MFTLSWTKRSTTHYVFHKRYLQKKRKILLALLLLDISYKLTIKNMFHVCYEKIYVLLLSCLTNDVQTHYFITRPLLWNKRVNQYIYIYFFTCIIVLTCLKYRVDICDWRRDKYVKLTRIINSTKSLNFFIQTVKHIIDC